MPNLKPLPHSSQVRPWASISDRLGTLESMWPSFEYYMDLHNGQYFPDDYGIIVSHVSRVNILIKQGRGKVV